ncbi:MAG: hypothetical protein ACPGLV_16380 [Bacteroidia bacterium]
MKKRILLLIVLLTQFYTTRAQVDIESQLGDLSNALPSYFLGYSKVISSNIGMPMAYTSQTQHWKKNWRVKYGVSFALQAFGVNNYTNGRIDQNTLYRSPSVGYFGKMSNAFGSEEASTLRFYFLNNKGERLINPSNGTYLAADISLPGGYGNELGAVPFVSPNLEIRLWKGLIISGSYMPLSWAIREFEQESFKLMANFYSVGAGLNFRNFTKVPVLSWLRFDASYGALNIAFNEFQDALDLDNSELFIIDFNSVNLSNNVVYSQFRGSMAIPVLKKAVVVLQAGSINSTFKYNFSYNLNVSINDEKIKDEYNVDIESDDFNLKTDFNYTEQIQQNFYYGGGVLLDSKIATFYLGYAALNAPTFLIKTSLRLL